MTAVTNAVPYTTMPQDLNIYLTLFADPSSHLSIPVGIIIGLLASFVQSLGLTIQRKSHVLNQSLPEHRRRLEHRRPLWLLGFAIFISSNLIGSLVQIASLPVVILAPLGAVSLLWNAFFARLILGDRFSPWMILGTILIAGGAILIAIFGIVPEPTRSLEDLLELFRRPAFAAYFSSLAFVVVVSLALTHLTEYTLTRKLAEVSTEGHLVLTPSNDSIIDLSQTSSRVGTDRNDGHENSTATERTPLLFNGKAKDLNSPAPDILQSLNRRRLLVAISYASFSGILSGMCLIFAKSGVELLLLTIQGQNQFWRWESWVLLVGLGIFAVLQLWYLHKALILADPTLVCPSAFCFYNLSSIVNGLVYFNQISLILPLHLALVILGIFILLGGVWVVSIQAGGGGVDVGPWSEETELLVPDSTICEEPESDLYDHEGVPSVHDGSQEVVLPQSDRSKKVKIGHVPLERETRSESSFFNTTESRLRLSLPDVPTSTQSIEREDQQPRRRNSLLSTSTGRRPPLEAHSTLPISPTYHTRYSLLHRLTANDLYHHARGSSTGHGIGSTSSIHHGALSPQMNAVSTFGSGLQIGLSPVSPGFTIMPKERKPRTSGLGRLSVGDLGRNRRRTVSEGDVNGQVRAYENLLQDGDVHEGEEAGEGHEAGEDGDIVLPAAGSTNGPLVDHQGHGRWGWIRRFVRKGKE